MIAALYSNELNTGTEPNSRQQLVIASPVVQQNNGRATDSYFTLSLLLGLDRQCGVLMFDAGRLAAFLYVSVYTLRETLVVSKEAVIRGYVFVCSVGIDEIVHCTCDYIS